MKKYLSPIKKIKNPVWWEQKGEAIPFLSYFPGYSSTITMSKNSPVALQHLVCFVEKGQFSYSYEENDMKRVSKQLFERTYKNPNFLTKINKKWHYLVDKYYKFCKKVDKVNIQNINDDQFIELFNKFCDLYLDAYSLGLLTDPFAVFSDEMFPKHLEKISKEKNKINEYFSKLTEPRRKTFFIEEKEDLFKILAYIQRKKISITSKKLSHFFKQHVSKYYWIFNNYARVKNVSADFFIKEVKRLINKKINAKEELSKIKKRFIELGIEKNKLIKKLGGDKKLKTFVKLMEDFSYMQDQRKKVNLTAHHYLVIFLKDLSRRTKISYGDLIYIYPTEFLEVLRNEKINKTILRLRKKCVNQSIIYRKVTILNGDLAKKLKKEMKLDIKVKKVIKVKGIVASLGKIKNRVRVLETPRDISKMKKGEILVTSMTRPDFMAGVKKAGAIVTDEGGMTCHAAIISRELGIPCIIGTKIATKVFKTGDFVEVDAHKGIVRKLSLKN